MNSDALLLISLWACAAKITTASQCRSSSSFRSLTAGPHNNYIVRLQRVEAGLNKALRYEQFSFMKSLMTFKPRDFKVLRFCRAGYRHFRYSYAALMLCMSDTAHVRGLVDASKSYNAELLRSVSETVYTLAWMMTGNVVYRATLVYTAASVSLTNPASSIPQFYLSINVVTISWKHFCADFLRLSTGMNSTAASVLHDNKLLLLTASKTIPDSETNSTPPFRRMETFL